MEPAVKEKIEEATNQILAKFYVAKIMSERIKSEDVQKAYEEYKKSFDKPRPGIEIGHILVKDEPTAREVIAKLNEGMDFSDLAKKYSIAASRDNGGREDILPLDELPPEMAELKKLEAGQHTRTPFQSLMGFHIVSVFRKLDAIDPLPVEEAKKMIEGNLFKTELNKLTKQLLKTAEIKGRNSNGKEIDLLPWLESLFVEQKENINKKEDLINNLDEMVIQSKMQHEG